MNTCKPVAISLVLAVAAGCANSPQQAAPTHRWASDEAVSAVRYRQDHARCLVTADMQADETSYSADSNEFKTYRQCMNNSGYVLTAAND